MKLALSILCENPNRRTGLSTLFHEFVRHALVECPDITWIVFAGPEQEWTIADERVEVVRDFPSNERRTARLWADHFWVAPAARRRGAACLLTIGFVPLRTAGLSIVMHVFTLHHRGAGGGVRALYRRVAVKRGLGRAALVITNSRWTATQLGPTRAPVIVSYEGLEHERFSPEGPKGVMGQPATYLLWVGNFYAYKRAELALVAYAQLAPELRARFPFLFVGGDWDGGRARAEDVARALQVQRDVRFLGWVPDSELPALYRGARAYVLSTSEETFGRSVAEAMACGCPCVLQDLPVLREVTAQAAIFVDFANAQAAGAALGRVCVDDQAIAPFRESGPRRAAKYSFQRLAKERIRAIAEALRSRESG